METPRECEDTLPSALETQSGESLSTYTPVTVSLDPDTAHPRLVLSVDRKHVIYGYPWHLPDNTEIFDTRLLVRGCEEFTPGRYGYTWQQVPNSPERFDTQLSVLGYEGFTSGRHCWEVEVGDAGYWAVGVARESVRRKGLFSLSPEEGIWAVELWLGQIRALTDPVTLLPPCGFPRRILVCLDCDRRQVTFINVGAKASIFTFPPGSLPRERIRPWLWTGSGSLFSLHP